MILRQSCHSRRFLAGIQVEHASGCPIRAFGHDKSRTCKFITGQRWAVMAITGEPSYLCGFIVPINHRSLWFNIYMKLEDV
ncbi:MAG: hypothetical protein ACUZ8O_12350 [Candidatus Anammoxibacter sp.]